MNKLESVLAEGSEELAQSLEALARKHGDAKAATAMMLHNSGALMTMLARRRIEPEIMAMFHRHCSSMFEAICELCDFDRNEIVKITEGIDEQCALLAAEVREAEGKG